MNCPCHGSPMYWQANVRMTAGGRWVCGVKRREWSHAYYNANREKALAQKRARWATDPAHRIAVRRRQIRGLRSRLVEQLNQLQQEVVSLGIES